MTWSEIHAEISAQRERERRALIVEKCLLVMQLHALTGLEILTLVDKWHRVRALARKTLNREQISED